MQTEHPVATVLVIEDRITVRQDIVELLEFESFDVIPARDGHEGIELAWKHNPDLIICDIMMPDIDGYQVLKTLRNDSRTATTPFIFLTARVDHVDQRQGMELGADDYIKKPLMVDELLSSIDAQLRKQADHRQILNERLDEMRLQITTALPHEFRTPLNSIIGFSEMLISYEYPKDPKQVNLWGKHINDAAKRLLELVENYIFYVRLQVALQSPKPITMRDPITGVELIAQEQAYKIAIDHHREADLDLQLATSPANLVVDYNMLSKLFSEIIDNSFKFSAIGEKVTITGETIDKTYRISIIDNGIGVTIEHLEEVGAYMQFERWLNEQQGVGLGLAIAKLICEYHNYDFDIQSKHSIGTTVTITFEA